MLLLALLLPLNNQAQKDSSSLPLTEAQFRTAYRTGLPLTEKRKLLSRAYQSHLFPFIYEETKRICQRDPKNSQAQMLFGLVAYNCSEGLSSSSLPFHVKDSKLTKNQWIDQLWKESQEALRLAVKLNPGNGDAQAELANFLLHDQRSRSRNEILRCLEIALKKAPESSRVQYIAGQAYSLVTEPYYNPVKAEQHLRKTVALQPDYSPASPYVLILSLRTYLKSVQF